MILFDIRLKIHFECWLVIFELLVLEFCDACWWIIMGLANQFGLDKL